MTVLIDKTFKNIHHPFLIKMLCKPGIEETYLKILKTAYDKTKAKITQKGKSWKHFHSEREQEKNVHFHIILKVLAIAINETQKGYQTWKGELKYPCLQMTQYSTRKNLNTPQNLLELINQFSKFTDYKIKIKKVAFCTLIINSPKEI